MTSAIARSAPSASRESTVFDQAIDQACRRIAPAWPLDRAIAVNPHWERIDLPLRRVAARLGVLAGIPVFAPRERMRTAWVDGRIRPEDLDAALRNAPDRSAWTHAACVEALDHEPVLARLPLPVDLIDGDVGRKARLPWRDAITHQISQTCAAYFDPRQAEWAPDRVDGLYAHWRESLRRDRGIGVLMDLHDLDRRLATLPETRAAAEQACRQHLALPEDTWADYFEAVLLSLLGWSSWCAHRAWEARLAGTRDDSLRDLLAIRLAWDALLLASPTTPSNSAPVEHRLQSAWAQAPRLVAEAEAALRVDELWQDAFDLGYQRELSARLATITTDASPEAAPEVQAVFCIDVRSEPLRRALEAVSPTTHTRGFAGFFGLPIAYTPLATGVGRPQVPGLLAASMAAVDQLDLDTAATRQVRAMRFDWTERWAGAGRWPSAAFSFVEAFGFASARDLFGWCRPSARARLGDGARLSAADRRRQRPVLVGADLDLRVDLCARILQALGLTAGHAPLVVLVGHGAQCANNAHAATLDCGACGGQSGEANARVLARLLNEAEVRAGLASRGIDIPAQTEFVAALHNTTTDELEGFDLDLLRDDTRARWQAWQALAAQASDQVRRERAPALGLDARAGHHDLHRALRRRANDGAQTRPEWGLAGNAALIIAPRQRTRGAHLGGRCFLHDYDPKRDGDGRLLEQCLTAPMLVAHWINWQYHASTCAPQRLGSGNKVLHNVVGGHVGVFEGNGGDLRIGLPLQSVHDGERWMHEPVRLTVLVDAPAARIERVIAAHATVRHLVEHRWLHLWRYDGDRLLRYDDGRWTPAFDPPPAQTLKRKCSTSPSLTT